MTINLGENIKELRLKKELTQEAFAEIMGVSFQSVSRWERGGSYPDITLLPGIAHYFGVTTDDLLGVDKIKNENKINEYLELYDAMRLKDTPFTFKQYQKAVKEFPGDYRLLVRYMELLMAEKTSSTDPDYEKTSREILSIYKSIQENCTCDSIRMWSKRLACQHLHTKSFITGNDEYQQKAEKILLEMPDLIDTREYLSTMLISDIQKHKTACREGINELLYLLQNSFIHYCYYEKEFPPQYKIDIINNILGLFKTFYPEGEYDKNFIHLVYNYGHLGHLYSELGNNEKALEYLRLAAEKAIECDLKRNEFEVTAKFYEKEKVFYEMNMCKRMKELMTKHYPLSKEFKETDEFKKIIELL